MSLWSRVANVFRGDRLNREIDEELQAHVAEALEHGRDPLEARREFGSTLRTREASRDVRLVVWLDSLRADAVFGWRQLVKKKVTSLAAVLSLALAIGACTSAFRLIDALLLRPLPVAHPERLYSVVFASGRRGRQNRHVRQLLVSHVPADARRHERPGRVDGGLLCRPLRPHVPVRPGDGEGVPAICFRLDVHRRWDCGRRPAGCLPKTTT